MPKHKRKPRGADLAEVRPMPTPTYLKAATDAATELLAAEAVQITRTLINNALAGNMKALRLCIERIVPFCRERPLGVNIPAARDALQITIALQTVFEGLGTGQLTPSEAQKLAAILENQRKAIETGALEERLLALEQQPKKRGEEMRGEFHDPTEETR